MFESILKALNCTIPDVALDQSSRRAVAYAIWNTLLRDGWVLPHYATDPETKPFSAAEASQD